MLEILTGDDRYNIDDNLIDSLKGEKITMDTWLSNTINEAERKSKIELLVSMIKKGIISLKQAAEQLGISVEKFEKEAKNLALL